MWRDFPAGERRPQASAKTVKLIDTTMLYAPASGGVKRYLKAKVDWLARHRPRVAHGLVLPGARDDHLGALNFVQAAALPFGGGYRWPTDLAGWSQRLMAERPDLIEAEDPYLPGRAAIEAGQALGAPVVGFCHSDVASLAIPAPQGRAAAALRRLWAGAFARFDRVLTPSHYMTGLLADAGLEQVETVPLGVDVEIFRPDAGARGRLRARLGLTSHARLLVFAGRAAPEKRVPVLIDAVRRLGGDYRLLLVGADHARDAQVLSLPYQTNERDLADILAGCDALVHANPYETLGLVVLEAMACGLPVVGIDHGGVGETVDHRFGELARRSRGPDMAEAIAALFTRDLAALGAVARETAVRQHRWDVTFEQLTGVYRRLTGLEAFCATRDGAPASDPC